MQKNTKIFIAGVNGMVGSALKRALNNRGYLNILAPTRSEIDFFDKNLVNDYIKKNNPEYILLAAARVGGIQANSLLKHEFLYENIEIQNNIILSAHSCGVNNLMFFGSSCVYPKNYDIPIKEENLLEGPLEETNEGYALAKICGIKLCNYLSESFHRNYFSVMPTNLYGTNDNFDPNSSHVIPGLLKKFHHAKINNEKVSIWGSGIARREFLHVDDLAEACIFLMENNYNYPIINIGTGDDILISELVDIIKDITNFNGIVEYDKSKSDGTLRKVLNINKIKELGWAPKRNFFNELKIIYGYAVQNKLI
tara:strand:+ start:642 stop:1571 length:930 start_codon:yes stop_codon:yes gene_type:complete